MGRPFAVSAHRLLAVLLLALLAAPAAAAGDYQVLGVEEVTLPGHLVRTDWTVQAGDAPVNRFRMHRLLRGGPQAPRGALLLVPPLSNPFGFYEVDEHGAYGSSFAAFFAHHGFEVWGYTYRGYDLRSGDCESGAVDCAPMATWGIAATTADVLWIRERMGEVLPGIAPVLGGYSMGAISTIGIVDAAPSGWAGAMILDGGLYSDDPAIRALNAGYCAGAEAALAAGQVYDGVSLPTVRLIARLAAAAPDELTPLPGFPPGFTNHQVLVFLLAVPQPGPLWPTPEFRRCDGSVEEDEFFYCSDDRVIAHSLAFFDYTDNRSLADVACSIAGDRTHTDDLDAFTAPVLLLGGGLGFGPLDDDLEHLFTSAPVTRVYLPAYGHSDLWFAPHHRAVLESEILRWLDGN
ncbi:MAG TPA: hypothetical protein VHQ65_09475 [Thermoanaerobaculia bacterium]|nr:hypothetical protein [Thermoanaerobaculia bacterium]